MFIFSFQISEKNKIFIHVMCIHNLILVLLAVNHSSYSLVILLQVRGIKFRKFRISLPPAHLLSTGAMTEIIIRCSFSSLPLVNSPPRDLQITAYK